MTRRAGPHRAAVLAAAICLLACALFETSLSLASDVDGARQIRPKIGGHFALTQPDGRVVTEMSFRGKWLIIYFGYTLCPDVCPTTLNAIADALETLGPLADKFQPIFITVDPERDTSTVMADYVKAFGSRFLGLSGTREEIAGAAREFHVFYAVRPLGHAEYTIDHSSFIYALDPNRAFVRLLTGNLPGHQLADEFRMLID